MQVRVLKFAAAAIATTVLSAGAIAGPYDGCDTIALGIQHCWSPSKVSRDDVVADLRKSRAADPSPRIGELAEAPVAQAGATAPTTLTRADVRRELQDAERLGQVQFGDLGRTQAEFNAQRDGLKRRETRTDVAVSR